MKVKNSSDKARQAELADYTLELKILKAQIFLYTEYPAKSIKILNSKLFAHKKIELEWSVLKCPASVRMQYYHVCT
jgi:hypothetical protein